MVDKKKRGQWQPLGKHIHGFMAKNNTGDVSWSIIKTSNIIFFCHAMCIVFPHDGSPTLF